MPTRNHPPTLRPRTLALCMQLLLAGIAVPALLTSTVTLAAEPPNTSRQTTIPPGPLGDALAHFAAQRGIRLSFDPALVAGHTSAGLQGQYDTAEGFFRLLEGTPFELDALGDGSYSLRNRPITQLAPAVVTAKLYGAPESNSLGDSTASVGVVTAEALRTGEIRSFREAFRRLGNVMDGDWTDAGFIIRGISSEGFVPGGAPVGSLYIDNVLQTLNGTRRGARGMWDVEQVEVYRGPQSTFSGRAAMAGAIHIKSKDPVFRREAGLSGTVGTDDLRNIAFMVNTPLGEQFALRVASEYERSDNGLHYPDYEGFKRTDDLGRDRYRNLRAKLLFTPSASPDTMALLSYSDAFDAPAPRDIASGPGYGLGADRGDFNIPTFTEVRSTRVRNLGLEVTHDFDDALRLTWLTGVHDSLTKRPSVNEGTAGEINVVRGAQDDHLFTQELRLNYTAERLKWVAGLYASHQRFDTTFERTLFDSRYDLQFLKRNTANVAAFGEVSYEFTPGYRAILGGRADYTRQKASHRNYRTQPLGGTPVTLSDYETRISEFNFVPRVGLAHDLDERQTVGVTYSQGFRNGGYAYDTTTTEVYEYDPEKAQNLELFYKGSLLDGRLQLNANLFHTRYEDQQVEMRLDPLDPFARRIVNAASSRSWGFEIEPTLHVTERLNAFMSIGYVRTRFRDFNDANYGDLSGKAFPEAPEWTVGLGAQYRFDSGWHVSGDARYTSGYLARLGTPPQDKLGSRVIVNTQTGYRTKDWEVNLFAENLFDKRYYTYLDSVGGLTYATLGNGRVVGVNARLTF